MGLTIIVLHFCHYIHLIHSTVVVGRVSHKISGMACHCCHWLPFPRVDMGAWALLDGHHSCSSHVSSRVLALLECKDSRGRGNCSGLAGQGRDGDWEHQGFWGRSYNTSQGYLGAISPSGVPLLSMWGISSVMKPYIITVIHIWCTCWMLLHQLVSLYVLFDYSWYYCYWTRWKCLGESSEAESPNLQRTRLRLRWPLN